MSTPNDDRKNRSELPYDPEKDPDADPEQLKTREEARQPSQAEGEDPDRA